MAYIVFDENKQELCLVLGVVHPKWFQSLLKKKKKKALKEKRSFEHKKQLNMIVDEGAYEIPGEQELFSAEKIAKIRSQVNASKKHNVKENANGSTAE